MSDNCLIVRTPVLDDAQRLVGYELSPYSASFASAVDDELPTLVTSQLGDRDSIWQLEGLLLFCKTSPAALVSPALLQLPPAHTVLRISVHDLHRADLVTQVQLLRQHGYRISLRDADSLPLAQSWLDLATYVECQIRQGVCSLSPADRDLLRQAGIRVLAGSIDDVESHAVCVAAGIGGFMTQLPAVQGSKGLNPVQRIVVQLMDMVHANRDVQQIEELIKHDAALSYKLFRYINSASFGLGIEIRSLRHAVTMLGYGPLYRWLSLLLVSTSDEVQNELLMEAAVVRGRLVELIGQSLLPQNEADNLFVLGMFSLLDRLLGMPMHEVLEQIHLPDAVAQALLRREGVYAALLSLAEACEHGNGELDKLAHALFVGVRQINQAHLSALVWTRQLGI